jgi:thioredoxin 1
MSECLKFTDKNFKEEVLDSESPVFVDFWGSWCPPCKMVEPVMDELAEHFDGEIKVGKLNVDQNPLTRSDFNIAAAPTFILFRGGKVLTRIIGARSTKQLLGLIETALNSKSPPSSKKPNTKKTGRSA